MKRSLLFLSALFFTLASSAHADDVAIYGTQAVSMRPNVLIIFDNSGSMANSTTSSSVYNPDDTYSGSYRTERVYDKGYDYNSGKYKWFYFASSLSEIKCQSLKETLQTQGYASGRISQYRPYNCGGSYRYLRTGNYLNYEAGGAGTMDTRLAVAKGVISSILEETDNMLFGLMVFNLEQGGRILETCGSTLVTQSDGTTSVDNTRIINKVKNLKAETWTPLAETLAEAGRYFAGKNSIFNGGSAYTSPISESCQKNYVIIITDGEPTKDDHPILFESNRPYLNGVSIAANAAAMDDGEALETSEYLDDVASFLYNNDLSTLGDGTALAKQNVQIFTIGFQTDQPLLYATAKMGRGDYYTANTASGLKEAFKYIVDTISQESSSYLAPVVPVNRTNPTMDSSHIFLAFFEPQSSGEWIGNLKKYKLASNNAIVDANDIPIANTDGTIREDVQSLWTTLGSDGNIVSKGGAGEQVQEQASRNIYTYQGSEADLTHTSNNLITGNSITDGTNPVLDATITRLRNGVDGWKLGAIIHSKPVVTNYSTTASSIYFGANDGLLHSINETNGTELWAFAPPGQLSRLSKLSDGVHDYYVDGSPAVSFGELITGTNILQPQLLAFGERRGGDRYYALDIRQQTAPRWKYQVLPSILSSSVNGGETLGQSWGTPKFATVMTSATVKANVMILPGGYDPQQDLETPASTDTIGRAIFSVDKENGSLSGININHGNWDKMTHSIVDFTPIDHDLDGVTTRIYAGDMGGNLFALADDIALEKQSDGSYRAENKSADGTWSYKKKVFSAPGKQIFYAPVTANMGTTNYIYFGTGDRESPLRTDQSNGIYAISHDWTQENLTQSNLTHVADTALNYALDISKSSGWYYTFPNSGEKIVSPIQVYGGNLYFTTYTPPATSGSTTTDPCATGVKGQGRSYSIKTVNGLPVPGGVSSKELSSPMANTTIEDGTLYEPVKETQISDTQRQSFTYWMEK